VAVKVAETPQKVTTEALVVVLVVPPLSVKAVRQTLRGRETLVEITFLALQHPFNLVVVVVVPVLLVLMVFLMLVEKVETALLLL
jgi:hypothetical protein